MSYQNRHLLNHLHRLLPEGLVADTAWFNRMGYSSPLRSRYVASGWLEPVVRGVFRRPAHSPGLGHAPVPLRWQHVVVSLQTVLRRPIAVGGRTALELEGLAHYASDRMPREIHLYSEGAMPSWLAKVRTDAEFVLHNGRKLFGMTPIADAISRRQEAAYGDGLDDSMHGGLVWRHFGNGEWPMALSMPERAILELMDELPARETFHQVDMLMEGLVNLSPSRVQGLLSDCPSVKVKRLFLWFAERSGHQWFERLDHGAVDLGRGKRMLVRGGKLDPKYQITVPEGFSAR